MCALALNRQRVQVPSHVVAFFQDILAMFASMRLRNEEKSRTTITAPLAASEEPKAKKLINLSTRQGYPTDNSIACDV